ncbi:MAG: DUF3617 family protein [Halioglobus sp.]
MKNYIALAVIVAATTATAETTLVPLDIEFGYWETTTEVQESEMMKSLLASVPEAQRAQMRQMMQGTIDSQVGRQCVTKESFADMEKMLQESFGGDNGPGCKFEVTKSSDTEFMGSINCAGMPTTVHTQVIDSKQHQSTMVSMIPGMGENRVISTAQWKSAECPADLK